VPAPVLAAGLAAELLRPVLAPVPAALAPTPADELVLPVPMPAEELVPVVPAAEAAGDALLRVVLPVPAPLVLDALLRPVDVLVLPVEVPLVPAELTPETPEHGATVGEVVLVLLGEIVTPATLQFNGICCSMISM
jgi:hypothetical protein